MLLSTLPPAIVILMKLSSNIVQISPDKPVANIIANHSILLSPFMIICIANINIAVVIKPITKPLQKSMNVEVFPFFFISFL